MANITIASSNPNKIRRLQKIIAAIRPSIQLSDIASLNIKAPEEDGLTQEENLLIKLNYYHKVLKANIICEDDIIELRIGDKYLPIVSINHFVNSDENQFVGWQKYLQENSVNGGKLVKLYGTVYDGKTRTGEVVIPLLVKTDNVNQNVSEKNVLNNFIGPAEIGKTYCEMSDSEKDEYMRKECSPVLDKLLAK